MDKHYQQRIFPFDFLSNTSQKIVNYLLGAIAISSFPALALSYLIYSVFPETESPSYPEGLIELFFVLVVFAPILETFLVWLGVSILKKLTSSVWITTFASAGVWALLHSLGTFAHGFVIFWSFVVFTYVFIVWYEKSRNYAFGMCMAVHMGQNVIALSIMQIPQFL